MKYEIVGKPYYPLLRISLEIKDRFFAHLNSVIAFDSNLKWKEEGEFSLFYVDIYPTELFLSPSIYGDISYIEISGQTLYLNSAYLLAFYGDLTLDKSWGGAKEFFKDEGRILLKVTGKGGIFLSANGIIYKKWISSLTFVAEKNILAFETSLDYKPYMVDKDNRAFYAFSGGGNMYLQSRSHSEENNKE